MAATTPKAASKSAPKAKAKPKAGADDRSRQSRGQARKDQIIATAVEMFATRGYRGTSLSDLADAVGMSHPGLLYYFGTKERLLEEVVESRETTERTGYLSSAPEGTTIFQLDVVARFMLDTAELTRLYVVLAAENIDDDGPLHEFFVARYERARQLVVSTLEQDQARGAVRADTDLAQIAIEVISLLMGLEIQWLMDPDAIDMVSVVRRYVDGLRERLSP